MRIEKRIKEGASITIYPEAHVWPYYTKIRNFSHVSMKFPTITNAPVFAVTNCFQKRKLIKTPKIITYIDGPFYPDSTLSVNENAIALKEKVYYAMVKRCEENSTYSYHNYVLKNDKTH